MVDMNSLPVPSEGNVSKMRNVTLIPQLGEAYLPIKGASSTWSSPSGSEKPVAGPPGIERMSVTDGSLSILAESVVLTTVDGPSAAGITTGAISERELLLSIC